MVRVNAAWISLQIADLLRRLEDRVLEAITAQGPDLLASPDTVDTAISAEETDRIKDAIDEIYDLADQLAQLGPRLPSGRIEINHREVWDGAVTALADGQVDSHDALLAARILDIPSGWAALADTLTSTDAPALWDMTLAELLIRFRGADERLVRRAIQEAGLEPELTFSSCSPDVLARLASVLRTGRAQAS
jgi:hypothetical protein